MRKLDILRNITPLLLLSGCITTTHKLDINTQASYDVSCTTFSEHCDDEECWIEKERFFSSHSNAGSAILFTDQGASCIVTNTSDGLTTGSFDEIIEDREGNTESETISSGIANKKGEFFRVEFGETL